MANLQMNKIPVALIFRVRLLRFSETFIQSQAQAMETFRPFFVGLRKVRGLELPKECTWIANEGGVRGALRELRFRFFGPGPDCTVGLRQLNPKLIHAHFGPDACEAIPLASQLNIPLVATFHGYDATMTDAGLSQTLHGRFYLRRRPKLHENVSLYIAVSDFIRGRIEQQGFPADRILVHYIGVDLDQFRPPANQRRSQHVLFVARLVEKKGCRFLIKAMSAVQSVLPDAELIIIGDGEERKGLESEARRQLKRYRFLGSQSPEAVREWMQKATVFCVPSVTASSGDAEGFGIVFAESQASGLPVVSFASGGINEAVAHQETGFLAPEGDWQKLAEYILALLQSPDLWDQFSRAGRRRVDQKFNLHKQTAKLEEIYEQVIAARFPGQSNVLAAARAQ
jgi:colanic acid/amylovoran biosynthesis glycosyltransferase